MEIYRKQYIDKLISKQGNGLIKIITGARRSGKSYLLFQLFRKYLLSENVGVRHIIEMSFDDFANRKYRKAEVFYDYILQRIHDDQPYYILLDEVQMLEEFVDVLNGLLKRQNLDIYVTGSNARFLSHDVATEFRGRGDQVHVQPFSFAEFMTAYEGNVENGLEEYLRYGGLPPVVLARGDANKAELLGSLLRETYLSDIKSRNHIRNEAELEELFLIIASCIGGLTNPQKLSNTFRSEKGVSINANTISTYIHYFEDAFLIEKALRFDIKGRHYINTPLKYYFSDLGLRNALLNFRQHEPNHLMENLIYNELRLRGYSVDVGVVVHNGKNPEGKSERKQLEVDFVCNRGHERHYIQSAYRLPDSDKLRQETESLTRLRDGFQRLLIVGDHTKRYTTPQGIEVVNIYDFLLNQR